MYDNCKNRKSFTRNKKNIKVISFMKKEILAVIISYNPDNLIINLYRSIKEQVDELIIIDNFTTEDNSKKYLDELSREVKIIYNNKRLLLLAQ